jgi:hypothetical protein
MKVRIILEFDLECEDGSPVKSREELMRASNDACHAIRMRLMGEGFLADHVLIGAYTVKATVLKGLTDIPA